MQEYHDPEQLELLSGKIKDILTEYYQDPEKIPASPGIDKKQIVSEFFEPVIPQTGMGLEQTLAYFRERVLPCSVKTWHPLFLNQMSAGASVPAILGDLLSSMMNATMATWEMTPVATILERNVSFWMARILGMKPGSSGIFLPGGSLSNLMALTVARNQKLGPKAASRGMKTFDTHGVIICSEGAHYSITNAANILGVGTDQVLKVKSNDRCEMIPEELEKTLAECDARDLRPFAVVATMGLTVTGGFDPLQSIVDICRGRDIHIHVDAAFGGGLALTGIGREVFRGIEHVDTVIWDAHKWFHVPLTCTVLLAPDVGIFKHTFSSNADYLFHPQEEHIDIAEDLGHYTLLCGKRFDALHVWMLFKAFGEHYFREMAERCVTLTREVYEFLECDPDFVPSYDPVSPIVCFRFLPEGSERWAATYQDRLQRWVREASKKSKLAMYNISKLKGHDHFRIILINPLTTKEHMVRLFEKMRELARTFMARHPPVIAS